MRFQYLGQCFPRWVGDENLLHTIISIEKELKKNRLTHACFFSLWQFILRKRMRNPTCSAKVKSYRWKKFWPNASNHSSTIRGHSEFVSVCLRIEQWYLRCSYCTSLCALSRLMYEVIGIMSCVPHDRQYTYIAIGHKHSQTLGIEHLIVWDWH